LDDLRDSSAGSRTPAHEVPRGVGADERPRHGRRAELKRRYALDGGDDDDEQRGTG